MEKKIIDNLLLRCMAVTLGLTLLAFGLLGYVAWKDGWIKIVPRKDMYRD